MENPYYERLLTNYRKLVESLNKIHTKKELKFDISCTYQRDIPDYEIENIFKYDLKRHIDFLKEIEEYSSKIPEYISSCEIDLFSKELKLECND
jgi:hypothetical protein